MASPVAVALPTGADEVLQVQHMEALCAEVVRRLDESLASRFVTTEMLAAHAARAADDSEELRGFANSLLSASRAETAKVTDELAAQVASLQALQQGVMAEAVAAEIGQRMEGISTAFNDTMARTYAGIQAGSMAEFANVEGRHQDLVRREIARLEGVIGVAMERVEASRFGIGSAASAQAAGPDDAPAASVPRAVGPDSPGGTQRAVPATPPHATGQELLSGSAPLNSDQQPAPTAPQRPADDGAPPDFWAAAATQRRGAAEASPGPGPDPRYMAPEPA